jgi:branched-subunit amino acid aminotransferase/4-amino-4-deoxychorismate lyase
MSDPQATPNGPFCSLCWVDGRIAPAGEPLLGVDDSAFCEGRGCYSTGRWTGRALRFAARHVARLARDARALGIGCVEPETALRAYHELGVAAFGSGEGVIRLQASRTSAGRVRLVGLARALGPEPPVWRAVSLPFAHPGAVAWGGAKISNRLIHALAADRVHAAGADEGLLFDAGDRLVEGSRANLVAVGEDGVARVPPAARGAVAGVAQALARDAVAGIVEGDTMRAQLASLRELVALNAVRGAVPVVELDGRPVGDGAAGPWARRLGAALDAAE